MSQERQQEDSKGRSEGNGSGEKHRKHPSFRRFNENIITDPGYVDIFPASRIPKQLHHLVKPIYRSTPSASRESLNSRGANMTEKGFRILTEPSNLSSILQWASDSEVGFHLHACTFAAALSQEREMLIRELEHIMYPKVHIALRMSGHLRLGVVRIYSKKVSYLYQDYNFFLINIRRS